jgi:hypothetical protein
MRNRFTASLLVLSASLAGTSALAEENAALNSAVNDSSVIQQRVTGTCSIGSYITAVGEDGSVNCETGSFGINNTRVGNSALRDNNGGKGNTAVGSAALLRNVTGVANTALGPGALGANEVGSFNTAVGSGVLNNNLGSANTAMGNNSMLQNKSGIRNTAVGVNALIKNMAGTNNTAIGIDALYSNVTGTHNVALGQGAGANIVDGSVNIMIGNRGELADSNTIRIGDANHNYTFVAGVAGVMTGINDAVTVVVDSNGQLGTVNSSARYKEDINAMGHASERLLSLNPVTFHYKQAYANGDKPVEYGLIAEEVAHVFPELVVFDEENRPQTVKYRLLSSLLLNELQKQNRELESLSGQVAEIEDLKMQIAELNQLIQKATQ